MSGWYFGKNCRWLHLEWGNLECVFVLPVVQQYSNLYKKKSRLQEILPISMGKAIKAFLSVIIFLEFL